MRYRQPWASIEQDDDGLIFRSAYDAGLVAALKARIPASERRWDNDDKAWIVAAQHGHLLADIAAMHLGVRVDVPRCDATPPARDRMIRLEYLGAVKDRGAESTAMGWVDGGWNAVFPLVVLQRWFCVETRPDEAPTLYGILGVAKSADAAAIKTAYRRLARQWHPDVCQEPDATTQFMAIQAAYDALSDPTRRARYEAGLQLAAGLDMPQSAAVWRSPLRCGWLLVEAIEQVGRIVVERIKQWEDIRNDQGLVLVSYWPRGADQFATRWA